MSSMLCVVEQEQAEACGSYFRASLITLSRYFGQYEKETYAEPT